MSCAGCEDCIFDSTKKDYHFEIHVTVDNVNHDDFKDVCDMIGVKALFIRNVIAPTGLYIVDTMTRSTVKGTKTQAYLELYRVSNELKAAGFKVVRNKIEAVPWFFEEVKNTMVYTDYGMPYFETHIEIETIDIWWLWMIAKMSGGYISYNSNKLNTYMVTYRKHDVTPEEFEQYISGKRDMLKMFGYNLGRSIVELTFCDDNKNHDNSWIN